MGAADSSVHVRQCLERLRAGDAAARDDLLAGAVERLRRLARKLLRDDFPRLRRWEETDDVFQNAAWRLYRALDGTVPETPLEFYRLAALQIRRELLDLARHYYGPHGQAARHASEAGDGTDMPTGRGPAAAPDDTYNPVQLAEWTEFHRHVDALPDAERAVADLLFYQGLSQEEAATLLGVDVRTVQRRWQRARLQLHAKLKADRPDG
jgi:RNA polymerase sigma-70 factor (ECF subfamily)